MKGLDSGHEIFSLLAQDLLAQFTNSANAAGQLNSQVSKEVASTTANIVGSAETALSDAVDTADVIAKQASICHRPSMLSVNQHPAAALYYGPYAMTTSLLCLECAEPGPRWPEMENCLPSTASKIPLPWTANWSRDQEMHSQTCLLIQHKCADRRFRSASSGADCKRGSLPSVRAGHCHRGLQRRLHCLRGRVLHSRLLFAARSRSRQSYR